MGYTGSKKLGREGLIYSSSYIARLMRKMGFKSVLKRKIKICTTDSNHAYPIAKNRLNRNFEAIQLGQMGQKEVSNITYIRVAEKWNYITTIIGLANRKLVARTPSSDMTTQNTFTKHRFKPVKSEKQHLIMFFIQIRGIQYASNLMTSLFYENRKITQSISIKGNCRDNALAEGFFKTLKYECTDRYYFKSVFKAENVIGKYLNWYNYQRLHSSLDHKTPAEKELEIKINNYRKVAY